MRKTLRILMELKLEIDYLVATDVLFRGLWLAAKKKSEYKERTTLKRD